MEEEKTLFSSFYKDSITMVAKLDKDSTINESHWLIYFMNLDSKKNPQYINKSNF